jgi:hypothetical protein
VIASELVVVVKAGPHAGEGWQPILRRKMQEERSAAGAVWWGYRGTGLDPVRQVIPLCGRGRVEIAMFETLSDPGTSGEVEAAEFSTDETNWRPVPAGVQITGSTRALVLREFQVVREEIDLSQYEVAVGPSTGRTADDFFFDGTRRRRNDRACLRRVERDVEPVSDVVTVRAVIVEPYAVYLR